MTPESTAPILKQYDALLGSIQDLCATAHIAGGAVRDTLLERPIKDIDLFLAEDATDEAAKLLRSKFGYVKVGEWATYEGFSDPAVARLAKFERADETIPFCLIALVKPKSMDVNVQRFDFGICMAAWDGHKIFRADQFYRDAKNQTFTLRRADNQPQFDYSMSRFHKLTKDRYAGWALAVSTEFEDLARQHSFARAWYRDSEDGKWTHRPNRLKPKSNPT
jgi:hypothetical protein